MMLKDGNQGENGPNKCFETQSIAGTGGAHGNVRWVGGVNPAANPGSAPSAPISTSGVAGAPIQKMDGTPKKG